MKKVGSYKKLVVAFISAGVILTVGLILFFVLQGRQQQDTTGTMLASSVEAERADINNAIEGTGSLAVADSSVVQIPKGLVIEKIKVQNGQTVKAGDVIATVTKASVANELLKIPDKSKFLSKETLDKFEEIFKLVNGLFAKK